MHWMVYAVIVVGVNLQPISMEAPKGACEQIAEAGLQGATPVLLRGHTAVWAKCVLEIEI